VCVLCKAKATTGKSQNATKTELRVAQILSEAQRALQKAYFLCLVVSVC